MSALLLRTLQRRFGFQKEHAQGLLLTYSRYQQLLRCQRSLMWTSSHSSYHSHHHHHHYHNQVLPRNPNNGAGSVSVLLSSSNFQGSGKDYHEGVRGMSSTSSVDSDDDDGNDNSSSYGMDEEVEVGHTVDIEEDLSHLRVKLYLPEENEEIRDILEQLYDASSIQQVLDLMEEHERDCSEINLKVASQALVTVWDLQKYLFKISVNFDPTRDYLDKPSFIEKITQHPVFIEKIVKPIINNCEELEDEPLLASLFCLKRMNYNIRGAECEKFIDECLRRQETLSLPSLSRLCVCLRDESLYGNLIVAKFYPLLEKYVNSMSEDEEVRLVAISLRNTLRIISSLMIDNFRSRLNELKDEIPKWENVTLCKILLLLIACRNFGTESKFVFDLVGKELTHRVPNMTLMDLLSLQKFLELGYLHPYELIEALVKRMMRIVQEGVSSYQSPRLDLLASISPYLKSLGQRRQMTTMVREYLENHNFEFASDVLLLILRHIRSKDLSLCDSYWEKAADLIEQVDRDNTYDRKVLKFAKDYVNFCYGMGFWYRKKEFEDTTKKYIYKLVENYIAGLQPALIHPGDFAKAFGVLTGLASFNDPIFRNIVIIKMLDDFAPQFKPGDLGVIARGLEAVTMNLFHQRRHSPKFYDRVIEICSILEEQCSRILLDPNNGPNHNDMVILHKVSLVTRKIKGESPLVDMSMRRLLECPIEDARSVKDLALALLTGNSNYPQANKLMADFIWENRFQEISPETTEKFVTQSFAVGWDDTRMNDVIQYCSSNLMRNWDKLGFLALLQTSLALCYYRHLPKELVQNIFSVEFLDQVDNELKSTYSANNYPLKLRQAMMELNRAVCIDMPDMNLPWFHGKFCEETLALSTFQETYLHTEVRDALSHIVGDAAAVQWNMCTPYYYTLDFLIEFDEKNRPIKKNHRQSLGFFQRFRQNHNESNVRRKVAVLILTPTSFTKGERALKGHFKLRRRHLEMLGYDVVEIDPKYWNSMFMSENIVRQNFLEKRLYANATTG